MASSNISSEEFGAPSSGIPTSPETVTSGSSGVIHSAMPVVPYLDTSGTSIAESAPGGYASSSTSPSTLGRAGSSRRAHSRRRYRTGGAYRSGTALVQGDAPVNIAEGMTQGTNLGTSPNLEIQRAAAAVVSTMGYDDVTDSRRSGEKYTYRAEFS